MPANNRTGDQLLPRIFPHYPARTRTRDGALMPSSRRVLMDATKKLEAKGRPVDFQELLRIEPDAGTTEVRNVRVRTGALAQSGDPLPGAVHVVLRGRHYGWQEGAAGPVRSRGELPCSRPARFLNQLDQRAQDQGKRDSRRHLRASNLRAERRGRPRPCGGDTGDPDDDRRDSLLSRLGSGQGFLRHWQRRVVLERGVGRHEEGERSTERIRRTLGETR